MKSTMEGNYHIHSTFSDGTMSLEEINKCVIALNFDEIGIVDHYCSIKYPINYLTEDNLDLFIDRVSSMSTKNVRFFSGLEIDGRLGLDFLQNMINQGIYMADFVVVEHVGDEMKDYLSFHDFLLFARQLSCPVGIVHPNIRMLSANQRYETTVQQLSEENIFIDAYIKNPYPNCLACFERDAGDCGYYLKEYNIPIVPGTDTHRCNNIYYAKGALELLSNEGYTTTLFKQKKSKKVH